MKFDMMTVVLALAAIVIGVSFWRAHKNPTLDFNFFDLLMDGGKLSKVSCLVMGAFAVHTWIMIKLTIGDKMTEGYLTIYGATWVAPLLAKMFSAPKEEK